MNPLDAYFARERELKKLVEASQPFTTRLSDLGAIGQSIARNSAYASIGSERISAYRELASRMEALTKPLASIAGDSQLHNAIEALQIRMGSIPEFSSTFGSRLKFGDDIVRQIENMSRMGRIIDGLNGTSASQLSKLIGGRSSAVAEIGRMTDQLTGFQKMAGSDLLKRIAGPPVFAANQLGGITALKMSTYAGSLASLGPNSALTGAAFDSILGEWSTRADLPSRFWRDPNYRRDMYREAKVDPWLIGANQQDTISLLVESGVVEGRVEDGRVTAIIEVGDVRLEIIASRARSRLQQAIDHFEVELRKFITTEMERALIDKGEEPAKWFVRRVSGPIVKQAKETRQAALKAGEIRAALIHYTNLGDLLQILMRSDNWEQIFAPFFGDQNMLRTDLERLIASRRPAMHARAVDPTRLAESLLVIRRLQSSLRAEQQSIEDWDDDI